MGSNPGPWQPLAATKVGWGPGAFQNSSRCVLLRTVHILLGRFMVSASRARPLPAKPVWPRFSVGLHAREALVESGPGRPQPGGWSPAPASRRGGCGRCLPPGSAAPEPGAGGTQGSPGAAGCGSRGETQGAEGRARGGRGEEGLLLSPSQQVGAGTRRPGTRGVGWGGWRGPRRDGGRGRAALESHWRTRRLEADK